MTSVNIGPQNSDSCSTSFPLVVVCSSYQRHGRWRGKQGQSGNQTAVCSFSIFLFFLPLRMLQVSGSRRQPEAQSFAVNGEIGSRLGPGPCIFGMVGTQLFRVTVSWLPSNLRTFLSGHHDGLHAPIFALLKWHGLAMPKDAPPRFQLPCVEKHAKDLFWHVAASLGGRLH